MELHNVLKDVESYPLTKKPDNQLDTGSEPVGQIGGVLRARRKLLRKSMAEIAADTGLSVAFVSQVERGVSSPSMTSLYKIAQALKTTPDQLLRVESNAQPISKKNARSTYAFGEPPRIYEKLGPGFAGALLHPMIIHRPPGSRSETMQNVGEEFCYLLEGHVRYRIDGEVFLLEPGDAIHIEAGKPHSSSVIGDVAVVEMWIATYPKVN